MPVCFTLAGTQSRTPLNTAVFMALCSSGEGQMKKGRDVEKKIKSYEEKREKRIVTELMKIQKHRWLRRGRAGRRKGYTECTVLHAMTVSAVLCHNSFSSLPPPKSTLPLQFGW